MFDKIIAVVTKVNDAINGVVWGWPMIILILGTGILLTIRTRGLQVRRFALSWSSTILPVFRGFGKKHKQDTKANSISQFEAFATAISGTVGTGNIIGVSSAILTGGPGAVFWMWVSAFFGMVTNYSENLLGIYYRRREKNGDLSGGAMYYLSEGLQWKKLGKVLGILAAVFCALAAIGMSGAQTNKISITLQSVLPTFDPKKVALIAGIVVAAVLALVIIGGIKRIGRVASILVPFMSLIFIVMAIVIICINITAVGSAFALIFKNIFGFRAVTGGVSGYVFAQVVQKGMARGVFSNEAGLGSSVIAHSVSETREPVKQGLWGVFEVFFDTFFICTLTALVILVSYDPTALYATDATGALIMTDAGASLGAFSMAFGTFGRIVFSIIIPLFAFTTILAWSFYGEKAIGFLFRNRSDKTRKIAVMVFKVLYILLVIVAAVINGELAWAISDTCNGLMALPNLVALVCLSGLVTKITKNYFARRRGEKVAPMLSAYPEMNEEFARELAEDGKASD
ncbi:MAG: alanine:cation symporter family protein [Clostridia bacterium]|nr:alanine:cation symporter family protein [Clostridia bacterium]